MSDTLKSISGRELIQRILKGEKDFSRTRLSSTEAPLNQEEGFEEMIAYLHKQDLRNEPVIAEGADWKGLRAPGLFFPSTRFAGADLSGADLRNSDLRRAAFNDAKLQQANLEGATIIHCRFMNTDLSGANMRGTDMYEAKLTGTVLRGTDLTFAQMPRIGLDGGDLTGAAVGGANLYRSDLRGVAGLDSVRDLGRASFHQTVVTQKQLETIEKAFRSLGYFDVRAE